MIDCCKSHACDVATAYNQQHGLAGRLIGLLNCTLPWL